jgi:hypothetical protein
VASGGTSDATPRPPSPLETVTERGAVRTRQVAPPALIVNVLPEEPSSASTK